MTKDEFARIIFYKGVESFMGALTERINSLSEDEKAEILDGVVETETEDSTDDKESDAESKDS